MTDIKTHDYVIEQAEREGEALLIGELLLYIERYHEDDRPGVSDAQLEAYVENLAEKNFFARGPDNVFEQIGERTTDSETWTGEEAFYVVGEDRISNFPLRWHEELGPDDDLRAFVRVMHEDIEASSEGTDTGGKGTGVPEQLLLDTATVIGDYARDEAKTELEEWRERDDLVMDADQHRAGRVRLPD